MSIHIGNMCGLWTPNESKCTSISNNYYNDNCPKALSYLNDQNTKYPCDVTQVHCVYLYYWIYYELFNNTHKNYVTKLYNAFLEVYASLGETICKDYKKTVTINLLEELHDFYNMFHKLKDINNECTRNKICNCVNDLSKLYIEYKNLCESNNPIYYDHLDIIRNIYKTFMQNESCEKLKHKMLSLFQEHNITFPIVVLIFTILFAQHNSCFQRVLRRKRNNCNNMDEDYNIFQYYKALSTTSSNSRHNILYHVVSFKHNVQKLRNYLLNNPK
ncbi:variable surface protein [Plasmodium gonderi]|uniref:Variable surface protein n=1 Tax=Plasmodium gonderi TaxID=77519 RepID=A0A1Y1JWA3_PLAGO|nr:variable surface protein [Plasmodium gonderi]GAW84623.1 variable surface protein [Plasmodium gonderi]